MFTLPRLKNRSGWKARRLPNGALVFTLHGLTLAVVTTRIVTIHHGGNETKLVKDCLNEISGALGLGYRVRIHQYRFYVDMRGKLYTFDMENKLTLTHN